MNRCTCCGQDFGSVSAFDHHRTGVHAYTFPEGMRMDPAREDGRRCLHASELAAATDRHGVNLFARNSRGAWSLARSIAHGHAQTVQRTEAP